MQVSNHSLNTQSPAEVALPPPRRMTEQEFIAWCDEKTRAEWVDGEVVMMSPVNRHHARLQVWLVSVLEGFVGKHNLGEVLGPEFAVRLGDPPRRRVPDVLFVAAEHLERIGPRHFEGPPDLCVEIVSPDSAARDWREKYLEYEAAGVREYWVIDPNSEHAEAYALASPAGDAPPRYHRLAEDDGRIRSTVIDGFWLKTAWFWPATRPKVLDALRELGLI
ncbi:MAG: Uma2 family endonuclease [Thermoguttaceae bacterium]